MASVMSNLKTCSVDINDLILPLRELCGLTQEQFAARVGVTVVTVNRWENNRAKPMPLARRQLRSLLVEISQSESDAAQKRAHRLLKQYFPQEH